MAADRIGWGWSRDPGAYQANLFSKYRITGSDFQEFWGRQDGKCAGCGQEFAHPWKREARMGLKPQVDHKHKYDERGFEKQCERADVRGLLCADCNKLLAKVKDNQQTLTNLQEYLAKHGDSLL
jgi:hypothetical protein